MMDYLAGLLDHPEFLYAEIVFAFVSLLYFAIRTGTTSALDTKVEFDEYFNQLSSVFWHLGFTLVMMFALKLFPNESAAQWSAFFFAEVIGAITVFRMIDVASQSAILIVLKGRRNPEEAWEQMVKFNAYKITLWSFSFQLLLSLPFAAIPKDLRNRRHFDEIALDAQNRKLDREMGRYRSKFTKKADKFNDTAILAVHNSGRARSSAVIWGFGVLVLGFVVTTVFLEVAH